MDIEELEPRKPARYEVGCDLSRFSVAELKQLAADLKAEISRVEQAVAAKESSRSAAASVFRQ